MVKLRWGFNQKAYAEGHFGFVQPEGLTIRDFGPNAPRLGDLPLLGFLFKHEKTELRHSVLTIFITPQVMDSDNLKPAWPLLNPEEHKIIPILPDELDGEY